MKWISLDDKKPRCCMDILFTDGKKVYYGWLETYFPLEELSFASASCRPISFPEGVTHWMPMPKPPKGI
jgi:hypothetical protein